MSSEEANKAIEAAEREWIEVKEAAFSGRRLAIVAIAIAVFSFVMASVALCSAGEPLSSAMARLPVYFEDRSDLEAKAEHTRQLAAAIEKASDARPKGVSRADWQALLVAVGYWESTFSMRIHRGDCYVKKGECDAGRARSPWQMHRNTFTAPVWDLLFGIEHVELQARTASEMLARSYWQCARSGVPCSDNTWPGFDKRFKTFVAVRARL
jgi:hypothetical protein